MKVIQLHYKTLRALRPFIEDVESYRFEIQGIRVISEPLSVTYVATDAKTMVARREPLNERKGSEHERLDMELTIPTDVVHAMLAVVDADVDKGLVVPDLWITVTTNGLAELNIGRFGSIVFKPVERDYPNWQQVFRTAQADEQASDLICVNMRYLRRFEKLGQKLNCGTMMVRNSKKMPLLVMFNEASNTVGLIMPLYKDRPNTFRPPQWATGEWSIQKPVKEPLTE